MEKLPKDIDEKDVVIFAGPEQCGQSTLMYAIIFGAESLQKSQFQYMMEVKTMNTEGHTSTFKQKSKPIIEPIDKKLCQSLKIGHDNKD